MTDEMIVISCTSSTLRNVPPGGTRTRILAQDQQYPHARVHDTRTHAREDREPPTRRHDAA